MWQPSSLRVLPIVAPNLEFSTFVHEDVTLANRVPRNRGTARRLNQLVGEMASLSVRCQEGPEGGATREGGGEGEGLGEEMTVKRQRADEGGVWGGARPQG